MSNRSRRAAARVVDAPVVDLVAGLSDRPVDAPAPAAPYYSEVDLIALGACMDVDPAPAGRVRASAHPLDATVTLLVSENPKKAGSKAAARFACYVDGGTVAECLKAGVRRDDLRFDEAHAFVMIH